MRNLKVISILAALLAVASLSCSKSNKGSRLPDNIQEMLNQENVCTCLLSVNKYKWKSEIIYYAPLRLTCCTTPDVVYFYKENGEPIHNPEWSSLQQFLDESELVENIFNCENEK